MRVDLCYESRFVFLKCKKGGRAAMLPLFSVWVELVSQIMHYDDYPALLVQSLAVASLSICLILLVAIELYI